MIPQHQWPERGTSKSYSFSFSSMLRSWRGLIAFLLAVFLFLLPVIRLISLSVLSEEGIDFSLYQEVFLEPATWQSIHNTVILTVCSTFIALFLGVGFAWIMAYCNVRGKKWIGFMIFLPFIIPSYIISLAWSQFLGNNGPVQFLFDLFSIKGEVFNIYSMGGMIWVLGISTYPLVYLLSVDVFRKIPRDLQDAAQIGGASQKTVFRKVIFPMALPGIGGGGLLAFLSNLDNFGIPAFLGIPANIRVLSTYIYEQVIGFGPSSFAKASVLSVLLGLIAISATILQWFLIRKNKVSETAKSDYTARYILSNRSRFIVEFLLWGFLLVTGFVPFLTMAATSLIRAYGLPLTWENLSFKNYSFLLFEDAKMINAVSNSLMLAFFTALICFVLGTALAYLRFKRPTLLNRLTEVIVTIPYALPGTVFALSLILMWIQPLPGWKPGIYGSVWILLIAYVTRFMVLQVKGSFAAFSQLDPSMEEAAQTSGAGFFAKWRKIFFPLLLPGIIGGALLVFLTALTELTVSSLLWSSGSETIGVVIFSYEQAGFSTYSTAFSSLIVLGIFIVGILFVGIEKKWKKGDKIQ